MIRIVEKNITAEINKIHKRTAFIDRKEAEVVCDILKDIREQGDEALLGYINKFEFPAKHINNIVVSQDEMKLAYESSSEQLKTLIEVAINNIRKYHQRFLLSSWQDNVYAESSYGMKVTAISRVGVYVPGGTAAYPTSVLMNVIPAQVAGVKEIVLVSPAGKNGKMDKSVLAAAYVLGLKEVFSVGGAQAVGALAYGTESIKKVDKIVGPGNIYVTLAKKEVFGIVGIDKMAGPSDVCIIADDSADPRFIAADMLAQAEHDTLASAILITDSFSLAKKVKEQIALQYKELPRKNILDRALSDNSLIIVQAGADAKSLATIADQLAPEHLEIFHAQQEEILELISHAGAIFVGEYSAEVIGDYMLGPNHVLPTGGTARFSSALSAIDFQKYSTVVRMKKSDFSQIGKDTASFADIEKLPAHAKAARLRNV